MREHSVYRVWIGAESLAEGNGYFDDGKHLPITLDEKHALKQALLIPLDASGQVPEELRRKIADVMDMRFRISTTNNSLAAAVCAALTETP